MQRKTTARHRPPRRVAVVRNARVIQLRGTVRPAYRPTQRQVVAIDALAEHAIAEYEAGRTISFRAIAAELGITLDDDVGSSGSTVSDSRPLSLCPSKQRAQT